MPKKKYSNKLGPKASSEPPIRKWAGSMGRLLLGLIIVAVGVGVSLYWMMHKPTAQRRPPRPEATLVEVSHVRTQTEKVVVRAMGPVVPATSIQLASRVSGQIVEISPQFIPGGHFKAGEKILQVEQRDYILIPELRRMCAESLFHEFVVVLGIAINFFWGMLGIASAAFAIAQNAVWSPMDEDSELGVIKPFWNGMAF